MSNFFKVASQAQLPPIDGVTVKVGDLGYTLDNGGFWDAAQPSSPPGTPPVWSFVDVLRGPPGPQGEAGFGLPGPQGQIGPPGLAGGRGPQGPAGKNAISILQQTMTIPCVGDVPYTIIVTDTSWMIAGALIFIPGAGTFTVTGSPLGPNTVQITNSGDPTNTPCGIMIGAGVSVSAANLRGPSGAQGIAGPSGPPGPQGVAGASVFSTLTQAFTVPAVGNAATAFVQNSTPFAAGQIVFIQAGDYFSVQSVNNTNNSMALVNQGYPGGAPQGTVLPIGNNVSATGPQGPMGIVGPAGPQGPQGLVGVAPTGAMFMWPTPTAPGGYLLCNGALVSRTTFAALFSIISTTFGAGDGSSTFALPDFSNGNFPIGAGASYPLASKGGEATHVLTIAELAAHSHTDLGHAHFCSGVDHLHSMQGHTHGMDHYHAWPPQAAHSHRITAHFASGYGTPGGGVALAQGAQTTETSSDNIPAGNTYYASQTNAAFANTGGPSAGTTAGSDRSLAFNSNPGFAALANTGSGTAHNNIPPYLAINYIIKT